jgi:prepilin-type N-terminal cleavage/methylation domain-containing protein
MEHISIFSLRIMRKLLNTSGDGFTLIELVVVFALVSILSGIGMVSLHNYTEQATVADTAAEFSAALSHARSRALSQVKPETSVCNANQLDGYRVTLSCLQGPCSGYAIIPVCGGEESTTVGSGTFPETVSVTATTQTVLFRTAADDQPEVDDGSPAETEVRFVFTGGSNETATVTVYQDGRIVDGE